MFGNCKGFGLRLKVNNKNLLSLRLESLYWVMFYNLKYLILFYIEY